VKHTVAKLVSENGWVASPRIASSEMEMETGRRGSKMRQLSIGVGRESLPQYTTVRTTLLEVKESIRRSLAGNVHYTVLFAVLDMLGPLL
jgi:hypothetical protein